MNISTQNIVDSKEITSSFNQGLSDEEILNGYRNGTIIPENNGKYWTEEDRNLLATMFHNKVGISQMALYFKRKELAIVQQLVIMGLINPSSLVKPESIDNTGLTKIDNSQNRARW